MANQTIEIRVVAFKEGGIYIAQGLDYDICAQASTLSDLPEKFAISVAANIAIALDLGKEPLKGINRAPQQFWDMFDAAQLTLEHPLSAINATTPLPTIQPTMKWSELVCA